eukprot:7160097-Pyramimonas_sp.AAC.1
MFVGRGRGGYHRDHGQGGAGETDARQLSAKEVETLANRLAALSEQDTMWDLIGDGMGLALSGGSLLICNWIYGLWKVGGGEGGGGHAYRASVDRFIQTLESLAELGVRLPSWGRDFVKRIYREGNSEADRLTHEARTGNVCVWRAH